VNKHPKEDLFYSIVGDWFETYKEKNSDYGDSFNKLLDPDEIGPVSFVTRAADKMERLKALIKQPAKVKSETFEDTVKDLGNYCAMYLMWAQEQGKGENERRDPLEQKLAYYCASCGDPIYFNDGIVYVPPENKPHCLACGMEVEK